MASIRTVLADTHALFLDGFERLLEEIDYPDVSVVARANSASQLNEILEKKRPDLLFMELNFTDEDGLSLIVHLKKEYPDMRLCILSGYVDHKFVKEAFQKGADGYYSKFNDSTELIECINELTLGNRFLGSGLQITPRKNSNGAAPTSQMEDRFMLKKKLTKREHEVLELIAKAMNNKDIAQKLYISDQTVGVHRKNIMRKLGVRNTVNLIRFAIDHQLV